MMLSFIRKRFPSKDRSNEHLQNFKSNPNQHKHQDDNIKRTQSADELNIQNNENKTKKKKEKKKKERPSSTFDQFDIISNVSPINKSYSDVDYFPMMSGALSPSINHHQTSKDPDSSDCYLNPSESLQTTNLINYVQTTVAKPQVFQIPVIDCRHEKHLPNYKDVDHQRTKALREVTEQRIQQKLFQ